MWEISPPVIRLFISTFQKGFPKPGSEVSFWHPYWERMFNLLPSLNIPYTLHPLQSFNCHTEPLCVCLSPIMCFPGRSPALPREPLSWFPVPFLQRMWTAVPFRVSFTSPGFAKTPLLLYKYRHSPLALGALLGCSTEASLSGPN